MNLWVNRIGRLAILPVALFFFISCKEEVSELGYKNPNTKFKVYQYDISLESSVLLRDSLRTSNFYFYNEPNRLLVGNYQDDKFGQVSTSFVTQYFKLSDAKLPAGAIYDSISLYLQYDLYHYGSKARTPQSLNVYEVGEVLKFENKRYFFNKTEVAQGQLLGSKSFSPDPEDFDDFATSSTDYDTVISVKVPLNYGFGREIFEAALQWRDSTDEGDDLFINYTKFTEKFKGLIIKPDASDKAIGFTPLGTESRLLLHYHTATDTTVLALGFGGLINFNQIKSDRSGTELASIQNFHQDYLQESEMRYVQSGTGILTKVDFTNFYNFIDSIPNFFVNSAELVVENVEAGSFTPPISMVLRNLNTETNRFRQIKNEHDSADLKFFKGYFYPDFSTGSSAALVDDDFVFYGRGDKASSLAYSSSKHSYSGVFTLLIQQMSLRGDERSKLSSFVLYPGSDLFSKPAFTSGAKSLNRAVFPKSGIKLRVTYTKPLNNQ